MPRAKGGFKTRQRRKKVLEQAKGYYSAKSRLFRIATEAVDKALQYAYRDRKVKTRVQVSLDYKDQCGCQGSRFDLQSIYCRGQKGKDCSKQESIG